jgi:hypothetical protein
MHELSLHILDIIQNSIEAGATKVALIIAEDPDDNYFRITVEDNGRGMSPEMVETVKDPFVTTRTTRNVGLGIPLFHSAAVQAGGDLQIESKLGEGTRIYITFQHSHIDRAPLGDIVATITTVLGGHPDLEFEYRHEYSGHAFEFRTADIRATLEDVALNHPMIIGWIRDHIKEGLAEIYGGEYE